MTEEYYNIGPSLNNIDFYSGGIQASSFVAITSSSTASTSKIAYASSSISISLNTTTTMQKITSALIAPSFSLTVDISTLEIINPLVYLEILTTASASSSKIVFATSSISLLSNAISSGTRLTTGESFISILSNSQVIGGKIDFASSSIFINSSTSLTTKSIQFLISELSFGFNTKINPPIRLSPGYVDETSIRSLLILDGKPLTNHNREFDISLTPINTEVVNWNNRRNRYYRRVNTSGRKTFTIRWSMLPNSTEYTVDNRQGRDFLHEVSEDPDVHQLKIVNQNESGVTPYTETTYSVFIRSYSENLIRRYISEGVYLYECNLVLEEV